jgi:hypothetical protein
MRPPVVLERSGRPGLDAGTSRFEGSCYLSGPKVLESPLLGYKRVQCGFEGTSVGKEVTIGRRTYLISAVKYRPHRPHSLECGCLQEFLAGGMVAGYRPPEHGYRPPRRIPPADRSPGNEQFCGAFS